MAYQGTMTNAVFAEAYTKALQEAFIDHIVYGSAMPQLPAPQGVMPSHINSPLRYCPDCQCREGETHKLGCSMLPLNRADSPDPDGPLVPLPAKPEPVRVVPDFPLACYRALKEG